MTTRFFRITAVVNESRNPSIIKKLYLYLYCIVDRKKKPARTVTIFKWASGSDAHRVPPTILSELSSSIMGTHIISRYGRCGGYRSRGLQAGETNRNSLLVSQQACPCKARKKTTHFMTNQELRMSRCSIWYCLALRIICSTTTRIE